MAFEESEGTSFFGKKFDRIFNYIECYVFRKFIVGILGNIGNKCYSIRKIYLLF